MLKVFIILFIFSLCYAVVLQISGRESHFFCSKDCKKCFKDCKDQQR